MRQILFKLACNSVFCNIVLVLVVVAGFMAVFSMNRELFPDFSMDEISIEVPFPGAAPMEVQEGICLKIEDALKGLAGIATFSTRAEENGGFAEITVKHGHDTQKVLDRVQTRISRISTFPDSAENPIIMEEIHRTEVMKLYLSANGSLKRLKELARDFKQELQGLDGVSQVELSGIREYEIHIEISQERLRSLGLTLEDIARRIQESSINLSCGLIRTKERNIRVRALGRRYTGSQLATVPVYSEPDGSLVSLGQIARIKDAFGDDPDMAWVNGMPAVVIEIYKTALEDSLTISSLVRKQILKKRSLTPETLKIDILYDLTQDLRARINLLVKNGLMGLCLVLVLLWMFLDFRLGFWAGMGIPVAILGALVMVWLMGGSINMLSIFGLIIVLGIVVDDAIVVGEAVFHHFQKGLSPLEAALEGVNEVGIPVGVSIITTVLAFLPLAFIGDVIGKFLAVLPMVVIPCLIVSLVECLFLLPAHLAQGMDSRCQKAPKSREFSWIRKKWARIHERIKKGPDRFADQIYLPFLKKALSHRYVCLFAAFCLLLLCSGLVLGGMIRFKVLPDDQSPIVLASVTMQSNASAHATKNALFRLEKALHSLSRQAQQKGILPIANWMTIVGSTVSDDPEKGVHCGGVQVLLNTKDHPGITPDRFLKMWKSEAGVIPEVRSLDFEVRTEGPPGEPVEIWIMGKDPSRLQQAAFELMGALGSMNGVYQVKSDAGLRVEELHVVLKPSAPFLGLTRAQLARQVRHAFYGCEIQRLQRGEDQVRIKVRYNESERQNISSLENLMIRTDQGHEFPLGSVARVSKKRGVQIIKRVDGLYCLTVSAGVDQEIQNPDKIIDRLTAGFLADQARQYPDIEFSFEGDEKHMKDALTGLYYGFPMAILGIFVIVATMLGSYTQPLIILFTIPFGLIGAVLGHLILGVDFSLMSIFGIVALSGIVVNDGLMLIERANKNLVLGMSFFQAVHQAGLRRFRAIVLTTVSTVGGLAPLILETSPQAAILIPMALSVSAGLVFATFLTLVLVPCMMAVLSDMRLAWHGMVKKNMKIKRQALEPAQRRRVLPDITGRRNEGIPSGSLS